MVAEEDPECHGGDVDDHGHDHGSGGSDDDIYADE